MQDKEPGKRGGNSYTSPFLRFSFYHSECEAVSGSVCNYVHSPSVLRVLQGPLFRKAPNCCRGSTVILVKKGVAHPTFTLECMWSIHCVGALGHTVV